MKKNIMSKRITSLVLSLVFALSIYAPAVAKGETEDLKAHYENVPHFFETEMVEVNGFAFEIQKSLNEDFQVVQTINRNFIPFSHNNAEAGKATLLALGFSEEWIDMLSEEDILTIATSPSIVSTTSDYYETANGDLIPFQPFGHEVSNLDRGYIRVQHIASREGNTRNYLFLTASNWRTMPSFRGMGSIGSAAQHMSYIPGSSHGTFSYRVYEGFNRNFVQTVHGTMLTIQQSTTMNSGAGSAAMFNLPSDSINFLGQRHVMENFNTIFSWRGVIAPNIDRFNSAGTYTHRTASLNFTPSISVSGLAIGIGFGINHHNYTTPLVLVWHQ